MNERIRELRDHAFVDTCTNPVLQRLPVDFCDKFAELIVRECLNTVLEQKEWVEDMPVHNPNDEAWNRARIQQSQHIIDKIKEHFGVEE